MAQAEDLSESSDRATITYEGLGLKMECVINTEKDVITQNIKTNIRRGHPQVWPCNSMIERNGEMVDNDITILMVAGGPSLLDSIEEIKEAQFNGGKVVALANTAHILVENGIRPNAHVLLDAKPNNANFIMPGIKTTYFIASQCDPGVFDRAEETGNDIHIWHAVNNEKDFEEIHEVYEAWAPVQAGATITLRALRLFHMLGYTRFELFGFDSCKLNNEHHAYDQPDADEQPCFNLAVEDKVFQVAPWMIHQAMEFMKIVKEFGLNWKMRVHGEGLIAHLIETGAKIPAGD